MIGFEDIPEEVIHFILNDLSLQEVWQFGLLSKATRKHSDHHFKRILPKFTFPKETKIKKLFMEQVIALISLQKTQENTFIHSPMGSGKTLMGLIHATICWEQHKKLTFILVTPKCLSSWLEHIKLCGWNLVKSKPEQSDVLVYHSSCKNHKSYLERIFNCRNAEVPQDWKYGVVISTSYYLCKGPLLNILKNMKCLDLIQQVIVDEAHTLKKYLKGLLYDLGRVVYLSATDFPSQKVQPKALNPPDREEDVLVDDYTQKLDLSNIKFINYEYNVPNMKIKIHPAKFSIDSKDASPTEPLKEISNILVSEFKKHKRIVMFVNWNPKVFNKRVKILEKACPSYEFLRFYTNNNNALNKMRKNKSKKPLVLLVSMLSITEGVNLEMADAALYLEFHSLVPVRARQCFGRIRRRNNPNKEIKNVFLFTEGNSKEYIRSMINGYIAQTFELNELGIHYKSEDRIKKNIDILNEYNIKVEELTTADMFAIFTWFETNELVEHFPEEDFTLDWKVRMAIMSRI